MNKKNLYIYTIGCQMNVYDSEQIARGLKSLGYKKAASLETADLVIVNTCSIRQKAQQKAFSFLGRLAGLKRKKRDLIIGFGGCVAQQEGEKIIERVPLTDIVFGTQAIGRLPKHIAKIEKEKCHIVDIKITDTIEESEFIKDVNGDGQVSKFVTIMRGCDNFCTYCVVPYVRGREASRSPDGIVEEISRLVDSGVREVTLLGQNVNSYGKKEGLCSFPELLYRVNSIDGLLRIRFTTSNPKDLSDDLIRAYKDIDKLCNHFHLPVQSGSNRILRKMNRKYTRESYLLRVDKLRQACPDIAITSDIIVGFPGESRDDFEQTLDLIKTVEFDNLFAFAYSDRPDTPASKFAEKVPESEKKERLQKLFALQQQFTMKKHNALVGKTELIMIEGLSKKQRGPEGKSGSKYNHNQWMGRTSSNKIVHFSHDHACSSGYDIQVGRMVNVRIEKAFAHSLWGKPVIFQPVSPGSKGEESYAA